MKSCLIGIFMTTFLILGGVFGLVFISLVAAEDVYNFYFQKGAAPQTVIQGGSGQNTLAKPPTAAPEAQPAASTPAAVSTTPAPAPPIAEPNPGFKSTTLSVGYGHTNDAVGSGMSYSLGLQYSFNRFLGVRTQARLRNLQADSPDYRLANSNQSANQWGGMAAVAFTPLRLDLVGHRLIEISALVGVDTHRKLAGSTGKKGQEQYSLATGYGPFIGATALFALNENVGIELQVNKSKQAAYVGGNLAFQF